MATKRGRAATLVAGLAALTACLGQTEEQAVAENELVVRSLMDALQRADTAAVVELFWPEAVYEDYASQLQHRGIEEIVGYVTSVHEWADVVYMNVGEVHVSASGAVAEWLFAGVQARPMGEIVLVATNREVVVTGVTIVEIDGGRIRRAADYTDTGALFLQLGGRLELPGGSVLELPEAR
jgi:ketosteroid isomerase-like protein